ncbi:hypothetical protein VNI00_016534 [Paramarasmius palmivorus]|uniref:Uncharacterized protein n=1 Tax=Paramarasmius palmivorus TaxID=297713 RepID=A0AAW0BEG9_9AGAR
MPRYRNENSRPKKPKDPIHPRAERPITASEKKMIDAMVGLTITQKNWLDSQINLHTMYCDSRWDRTHVRFWSYMQYKTRAFLLRWTPGMCSLTSQIIIRYYDWKIDGTLVGLKKLERNWFPRTPPSSPLAKQPVSALSFPMFRTGIESPLKLSITNDGRRFMPLFDD